MNSNCQNLSNHRMPLHNMNAFKRISFQATKTWQVVDLCFILGSNTAKAELVSELKLKYQDLLKEFHGLINSIKPQAKEDARYEISQGVMLHYHSFQAESDRLIAMFQKGDSSFEGFVQAYRMARLRFHTGSYIHEKLTSILSSVR